jgi:hypothetical protein
MHASVRADVQWIDSADGLRAGLKEFAARGIDRAAVQRHYPGDEIKFYGVAGGRFFHWFYPEKDSIASGGPGDPGDAGDPGDDDERCPIDVIALQDLAERAAAAVGLNIYGGDVIVDASGHLTLIDLNDWPSFAPCRDRAAEAIAGYLIGHVNAAWNTGLVANPDTRAV